MIWNLFFFITTIISLGVPDHHDSPEESAHALSFFIILDSISNRFCNFAIYFLWNGYGDKNTVGR